MNDRLFIAVVGSRNSGKSTTWNALFGRRQKGEDGIAPPHP
jgi:GTPase Era involved in 16S rRNA processing